MVGRASLLVLVVLAACGGPNQGKPHALPRGPKKVTPPPRPEDKPVELTWVDDCPGRRIPTDAWKAKKDRKAAKPLVEAGHTFLSSASATTDPVQQSNQIVLAVEKYKAALEANNYDAEATYYLAVAYAMARHKGCAIEMVERLHDLETNPDLAGGKKRLESFLGQVSSEPAFAPFRSQLP